MFLLRVVSCATEPSIQRFVYQQIMWLMHSLEVRNLIKHFERVRAVRDVSFNVPEGAIYGIIGRNGAGKTTIIRMLMNIYLPDSGDILFRGEHLTPAHQNSMGYLPEERGLYKKMKVLDTVLFFAELKGCKAADVKEKAIKLLSELGLEKRLQSKVTELSKGNQQKVQFVSTIIHDPDFIILDEPFSGLDPVNTNILKDIVMDLRSKGKVIILSTHLMDFAERMCDHIALINHGSLLLEGNLATIKREFGERNVALQSSISISELSSLQWVEEVRELEDHWLLTLGSPEDSQPLLKYLVDNGHSIQRYDANTTTLNDIFLSVVGEKEVAA